MFLLRKICLKVDLCSSNLCYLRAHCSSIVFGLHVCKKTKGPHILGYRKASGQEMGGDEAVAATRKVKERSHNSQEEWA